MDLVLNFKELLLPPLLAFFGSVANESNLQTKDSVYTAMGMYLEPFAHAKFWTALTNIFQQVCLLRLSTKISILTIS